MAQFLQEILGFLPKFSVILVASISFFLIWILEHLTTWFEKVTRLPWMKEENEHLRDKVKNQE